VTKSQKIRFSWFLLFFGITGTHLIFQWGLIAGIYTTLLIWSFFVLCFPVPQSALITSGIVSHLSSRTIRYAGGIVWITALSLNIFTYLAIPYAYLRSNTTFLLYRILSNPWPYWLIIGTCMLGGIYNALVTRGASLSIKNFLFRHLAAKTVFFTIGIVTLLYLSYVELVILLVAKTSC